MSELTLFDAILNAPKPGSAVNNLSNELKEKFWGKGVMPVELESYVLKAAAQAIATGNEKSIFNDLKLFLSTQKQSQTLSLGRCL